MKKIVCATLLAFNLASCDSGDTTRDTPPERDVETISFAMDTAEHGWKVGYSDYSAQLDIEDTLTYGFEQLPEPLSDLSGLRVSGDNYSADLFMFSAKRFSGFEANTRYELEMEIIFATNVPSGCVGAGSSPGEGVVIKAGATTFEPEVIDDGTGNFLMNLDKGSPSSSGSDAITIGDFANSKSCEDRDHSYELKTLRNEDDSFFVETDSSGDLWLLFGTDSGFEGVTTIYYISGTVVATEAL